MKKSIIILAILNLMAGMLVASCKSDTGKEVNADDVKATEEAAKQAKEDEMLDELRAKKIADADSVAWNAYKKETEAKIKANEKTISDLKMKNKKANKKDDPYSKIVEQIEKENKDLNAKVDSYKVSHTSDWEDFKKDLNKDLNELDKKLNDLAGDKKK